ncbi:MAG: metal-dependent transcriptional regulator [Clostridium sp.]|nr:metal-dependent transcriptional regulator [Lachnoclostridium sp.]MCM1254137.1 metal-dependent transcriptional regulator [Clostridium sp.]
MLQRTGKVRAIDVAGYLGFAKTSVSHGLQLLRENGFLTRDRQGYLYLTETGQKEAEKIHARHCFFVQWLTEAGIDRETAERDACRMKHAISEESFGKLVSHTNQYSSS